MPNISHKPTPETRKLVESMCASGISHEQMALVIEIDPKTLRKHYRKELDTSKAKALAQVAGKLYQNCMAGDRASIFFYLKTQGQWSETHKIEHSGNEENPVYIKDITRTIIDPAKEEDED